MAGYPVLQSLPATRPDPLESPLKRSLVERASNAFLTGVRSIGEHLDASRLSDMGPEYKVTPFRAGGVSRGAVAAKVLTTLMGSARRDANYRETMRLKGEENRKTALELQALEQRVNAPTYSYTLPSGQTVAGLSGPERVTAEDHFTVPEKADPNPARDYDMPEYGFHYHGTKEGAVIALRLFLQKKAGETSRGTIGSQNAALNSEERSAMAEQAAAESNMVNDPKVFQEVERWIARATEGPGWKPALKLIGISPEAWKAALAKAEDGEPEQMRMLTSQARSYLMRKASAKARARVAPQFAQRLREIRARRSQMLGFEPQAAPTDDPFARLEALMNQPD